MKNPKYTLRLFALLILLGGFTATSILPVQAEEKKAEQTKEEGKKKANGDEEPECD